VYFSIADTVSCSPFKPFTGSAVYHNPPPPPAPHFSPALVYFACLWLLNHI
jgi:hypothetical protein